MGRHAPASPKNRENEENFPFSYSLIKSVRFLKGGKQLTRVSFEFKLSEKKIGDERLLGTVWRSRRSIDLITG